MSTAANQRFTDFTSVPDRLPDVAMALTIVRSLRRHVVPVRHAIALGERRARSWFGVGLLSLTWSVCGEGAANAASGAVGAETSGQLIEVVVTVGTRVRARAAADTAVPVDVFDREQVESVNSSDLVDVLNAIVPSFSVRRQPISDGASFIRPVHLRGLDSHHMLILIDGKRRHRAALMQLGGFGAHGVDVGSIPSIAIEAVEVLRDGSAAQYGSDAIAGVVNIRLKKHDSGFDLRARAGGYTRGDGEELTLEGNAGLPLGTGGFLNVSGQFSDAAPTSRSEPYDIAIGNSGNTPLEATGSRLTVDGVTYFGPDALTYTWSPAGELLQAALGSDGIPDDLDTRFRRQLSPRRRGPAFRKPGAGLGPAGAPAGHRRHQCRTADAGAGADAGDRARVGRRTLWVCQLLDQGPEWRLFLSAPRRQPVAAGATRGRFHLRSPCSPLPGGFHAPVLR